MSASRGLTADHHDFIYEPKTDTEVETEIKELEARRKQLEGDITAIHVDDANQRNAEQLRQDIEQLESELAQLQQSRKG